MKRERIFPLEASVDGFLDVCTSPEQTTIILLQPDVGVDDKKKNYFRTSRCSRGVCETIEEAAAAKDDSIDYRAKQAV